MQEAIQPAVEVATLNMGGWITMVFSLVLVWVGTFWCFKRVLRSPSEEKVPPGLGP